MTGLPALAPDDSIAPVYRSFLARLVADGFAGDIDTRYATRLTLATDNSAFQQLPAGALFPRDEADIARVGALLGETMFADVYVAPRGGGTSTIGCSLTAGLIVDCSRYMNQIGAIDLDAGIVTVQPGVVLDQLNDALANHGYFFAPNVAPSNRATLGGMANTDGCGRGSRVHGKTSDHVRAMRLVLTDGSRCQIASAAAAPDADTPLATIQREVAETVQENSDEIERVFPALSRYLSGYNLAHAIDGDGRLNLCKLICGSEGTLALVSELTLELTPKSTARVLFALRYATFDAALRDAQTLVTYDPGSIETVDNVVMGLARDNPIYERVRDYIENADGSTPAAVNLVEFTGVTALPNEAETLDKALARGQGTAIGHYRAESTEAITALWDLRRAGVGLLGSAAGARKPLPFVEDTVVDPRVLPDYVADFRAILDEYSLSYGMFGHIDVGCLHVRPALDLTDPADEVIMRRVTERVAQLAESYGGLLWNEHGKGYRSEYNRPYFGETLYAALARIKRAFDPRNQLNPGKIVAPADARTPIAAMDAPTRGTFDRQIPSDERAAFQPALDCNGNGACFDYDATHVMCPSYRGTGDRLHSPKGRATAMREWLRQLANQDRRFEDLPFANGSLAVRAVTDLGRRARESTDDFSHQVWTAMDGCLSCQACATQCPVKVDVPSFKSRFLAAYHGRFPRPPADYALAYLETGSAWVARTPGMANWIMQRPTVRGFLAKRLGLADPPLLSQPSVAHFLRGHPEFRFTDANWAAMRSEDRSRAVFIVQDAFTSFFDARVVRTVLWTLRVLGYRPLVLPFKPSGKPLQVKGFLPEFERLARRQAEYLASIQALGRPLVGIEPSVTRIYNHEYQQLSAIDRPQVQPLEHWLVRVMDTSASEGAGAPTHTLFQHCTVGSADTQSARDWQAVFRSVGLSLARTELGCCGMSGAYGHEQRHRDTSRTIFEQAWGPAYAASDVPPVVPGYSCRSQLRRFGQKHPIHPIEAILKAIVSSVSEYE